MIAQEEPHVALARTANMPAGVRGVTWTPATRVMRMRAPVPGRGATPPGTAFISPKWVM